MDSNNAKTVKVVIVKNGPYRVFGGLPLSREVIATDGGGDSVRWDRQHTYAVEEQYALCRCGRSANKPFCDGSHKKSAFDGSETASRAAYLAQAKVIRGPAMSLTDVENLCAFARFCDPHGKVWNLVQQSDRPDTGKRFVAQTCDCPSGRLVAWDNRTGQAIEPEFEPSLALVEDPAQGCSGPLWLRGGVPLVGADGFEYEVRNRMTLCRCGASKNKPFCDGSHAAVGFDDTH